MDQKSRYENLIVRLNKIEFEISEIKDILVQSQVNANLLIEHIKNKFGGNLI